MSEVANLFFSTHLAYGFAAGNYWSTMIADICAALGRAGAACDRVEAADNNAFNAFLLEARRQPRQFIATFNFMVPFPDNSIGGKKIFVPELFAARAVTLFLDHPIHLAPMIARFESAARQHVYRPAPAPTPIYGVMEADHAIVLHDLGIEPDRIFVFPQAGPSPVDALIPLAERPIDLLFHGSIADLTPEDEFLHAHRFIGPDFPKAVRETLDAALTGREDVYGAAKKALAAMGKSTTVAQIAEFARIIDVRARLVRRWALLSGLADLKIHFCGNVAESFRRANPNGVYLGAKPFDDVMALARQSKIVLNDTINLRQAALMRFHYSMAQGCVLATESSAWFRDAFADGEDAVLLEPGTPHAEILRDVLDDPGRAQRIAEAGRAKQMRAHQWDNRVGNFLETVAK